MAISVDGTSASRVTCLVISRPFLRLECAPCTHHMKAFSGPQPGEFLCMEAWPFGVIVKPSRHIAAFAPDHEPGLDTRDVILVAIGGVCRRLQPQYLALARRLW